MSRHELLLLSVLILIHSCAGREDSIRPNDRAVNPEGVTTLREARGLGDVDSRWRIDSSVRAIFEDSKGMFWFGTHEEGVCRFDGETFTYFTTEHGLCNKQVRSIQEDARGHIWFGTGSGVSYFDGSTIHTPAIQGIGGSGEGLESQRNHAVDNWSVKVSDLWFDAGHRNGVLRFDGERLTYLPFPMPHEDSMLPANDPNLPPYSVYASHKTRDGAVWFGTVARGVLGFDGASFQYVHEAGFGPFLVRSIFQDDSGRYWFGDNGAGVYRYDGAHLTNLTDRHGLGNPGFVNGANRGMRGTLARIWAIEQDDQGDMWFGTIDAGVWRYDGTSLTNYTVKDGLPDNSIECIYKDKRGTLWFGTAGGGVCFFDGSVFVRFADSGPQPSETSSLPDFLTHQPNAPRMIAK